MDILEVTNKDAVADAFGQLAAHVRFLPSIMMMLITSKFIFLFVVEVVLIVMITKAGWAAATYHKYVDETVRHYSSNMSRANPAFEDTENDKVAQHQHERVMAYMNSQAAQEQPPARAPAKPETPDRYNDTTVQPFVYPQRNAYSRQPDDLHRRYESRQPDEKQNSIPRPNSLAIPIRNNSRPPSQQQNGPRGPVDDRDIDSRLSHYTSSNGSVIRSVEPLKDENISERQQQQTRVKVLPSVAEINRNSSEVKQRPKVPPKPTNRNSNPPPAYVEERRKDRPENQPAAAKVNRNSSTIASEELRGQHPWSYFKARDDIPNKKAFNELKEDEELPPVPIPDYTLHFPKGRRANLSSDSDGDGSWNRNEQRY